MSSAEFEYSARERAVVAGLPKELRSKTKTALVEAVVPEAVPENSGLSCSYYDVEIKNPTLEGNAPYTASCNDVIEGLDMTFAEANIFKEIWRSAAARTLGKLKAGHTEQRGAEKVVFYAARNAIQKGAK